MNSNSPRENPWTLATSRNVSDHPSPSMVFDRRHVNYRVDSIQGALSAWQSHASLTAAVARDLPSPSPRTVVIAGVTSSCGRAGMC